MFTGRTKNLKAGARPNKQKSTANFEKRFRATGKQVKAMHPSLQFGVLENPASSRQHSSRFFVPRCLLSKPCSVAVKRHFKRSTEAVRRFPILRRHTFYITARSPEQQKFHAGKGRRAHRTVSVRLRLKDEVNGERLTIHDGDFLALRAEGLMPGGNGVFSWWKIRHRESAILSRYRKMAGLQNDKIGLHPSVNVALNGDELFLIVRVRKGRSCRWLQLVPFAIDSWYRMNVVRPGVAV